MGAVGGHTENTSKQLSVFLQHSSSNDCLHGRHPSKHALGIRQECHLRTTLFATVTAETSLGIFIVQCLCVIMFLKKWAHQMYVVSLQFSLKRKRRLNELHVDDLWG